MSDIRGIPVSGYIGQGRLIAVSGISTGFTVGNFYRPLALGVDCQPVPPVMYFVVANDAGFVVPIPASMFRFEIGTFQFQ